jgi:catechol 2,3-dioxygenase-like lactoylglutathione lyase family enzyme
MPETGMLGWPVWVGVVTEDLQSQRTFYRDVLGLQEHDAGEDFVIFDVDGHILELLARSDAPQYAERSVCVGFLVEDIEAAREELLRRGVEPVTGVEGPAEGQYWTYFRDGEGNLFELVQRVRHSAEP